ncbi:tRNA (guanosine(37)-N1)-methyltransferase TrmD [Mahella australiensis]|uniref:tRNA (guanine-N(1)-)-methyltransferase n=1 Tax=Mahella australiensis (strain DSM 15567 / CIP 107919 / 50-1 BON) TaxID=697281 RepID=F4A2S8_MAHA5|nr:tRNA (guanosine(37)-N1)-methyltransferase TrmD [Mahella australiensis]AEE96258.1 tRNA (Guanine37-N(1)-) methyltransferase [Mahella australiensis 50-1 BON]
MIIDILTLFPQMFMPAFTHSVLGRAIANGILTVNLYDIRDFSRDKHGKVDDYPYGGGAGMILTPQPVFDAFDYIKQRYPDDKLHRIYMSPQGRRFDQATAHRLSGHCHLVILCGHYEGIDQRIIDALIDEEISIGDYVLTGGELPAMVIVDAVSRLVPGVLHKDESYMDESFSSGLLEYPQYTRPYNYEGMSVPDVLLSGDHAAVKEWRNKMALKRTACRRPDLLNDMDERRI